MYIQEVGSFQSKIAHLHEKNEKNKDRHCYYIQLALSLKLYLTNLGTFRDDGLFYA